MAQAFGSEEMNKIMNRCNIILIFIFLFSLVSSYKALCIESPLPFSPGEVMTFRVRWSFLPAGIITLRVGPITKLKGINVHHFILKASTYKWVDLIYKVRERVDSYTDMIRGQSVLYRKVRKGHSKKDVSVLFNWDTYTAEYIQKGNSLYKVSIPPGTADPLSVFYIFRCMKLKKGITLKRYVSDGKKCVLGEAKIIKKEDITVNSVKYSTFLVEPEIKHIGGVFKKKKGAKLQIWVTNDFRHIPVRIKSKVIVGSFVADLISYVPGGSYPGPKSNDLPLYIDPLF
jgi:hypothetical protein